MNQLTLFDKKNSNVVYVRFKFRNQLDIRAASCACEQFLYGVL